MEKEQSSFSFSKVVILIIVTVAVIAVIFMTVTAGDDTVEVADGHKAKSALESGLVVGDTVPEFRAMDINSQPFKFEPNNDKPVWLIFNATWCSSCRAEIPEIKQAAKDDKVTVISVYLNESTPQVKQFADKLDLTHTQLPDPQGQISQSFGAVAVPTHLFISHDGTVVNKHVGALTEKQIDENLKELLKK